MFNQRKTYYLTLSGPRRGERVVASVITDDQILAEKLFGCGLRNEKDFCFNGLYTEEEVLHMFKPGTDIIGTFNPDRNGCEKHKDYHNVPVFEVDDKKVYRIKNQERFLFDLAVDNCSFEYVKDILSGKMPALSSAAIQMNTNAVKQPAVSVVKPVNEDKSAILDDPLDVFDKNCDDPIFDDEEDSDVKQITSAVGNIEDLSSVYTEINTTRNKDSDSADDDFISSLDTMFYHSQKEVVQSDAFSHDEKLRTRFGIDQSEPVISERIRSFFGIKNS